MSDPRKPELSAEPEAEEPEGRTVPLAELMAERQRRKELNNKVQQLEETFQRFMQRTPTRPPKMVLNPKSVVLKLRTAK